MVFGLFEVQSGLFNFWDKGRPVMVTVKALGSEKNWTKPDFQTLIMQEAKYS